MQAIDEALYTLFTGDDTLMEIVAGVYNTVTPADAEGGVSVTYPLIVFQQISGADDYTWANRVRTAYLYQIRVIGVGLDREPLNEALEQVDVLLMDAALVSGTTLYCRRAGELPYVAEMDGGVIYQQVGATYRIEVG